MGTAESRRKPIAMRPRDQQSLRGISSVTNHSSITCKRASLNRNIDQASKDRQCLKLGIIVSWPRLSRNIVVTSAEIEIRGWSVSLGTVAWSVFDGKITISSSLGLMPTVFQVSILGRSINPRSALDGVNAPGEISLG